MKKNKMMRIASVLLVAVLLSTSVISGTFAKYTTSDSAKDSARVAKWGVTVKVEGDNAFAEEYTQKGSQDANSVVSSVKTTTGTNAKEGESVVAPGTSGTLTTVKIEGTPEVAVKVNYNATLKLEGWKIDKQEDAAAAADNQETTDNTEEYCPLIFTVKITTKDDDSEETTTTYVYKIGTVTGNNDTSTTTTTGENSETVTTVTCRNIATLQEQVLKAICGDTANKATKDHSYEANTNLYRQVEVTWEWAFEDKTENSYQTDAKDTALGNLETAPKITFSLTVTVTQVD